MYVSYLYVTKTRLFYGLRFCMEDQMKISNYEKSCQKNMTNVL